MALVIKDRVRQTSTTAGTGTITLSGSVTGYQNFSVIGTGNTTYYTIADQSGSNWEVGLGTYTSPNQLARTTVYESSNANALVNFGSNIKDVFVTLPAEAVPIGGITGSGTTNYVPKFTSSGEIGNSIIKSDVTVEVYCPTSSAYNFKLFTQSDAYGYSHTDDTHTFATYLDADGVWVGADTSDPLILMQASAEAMRIDTAQNVGIGTTTPTAKLDVNGDIKGTTITANTQIVLPTVTSGHIGTGYIQMEDSGDGTYDVLSIFAYDPVGDAPYPVRFPGGMIGTQIALLSPDYLTNYQYINFLCPTGMSSYYNLTLPPTAGSANQVLQTDGTGVTSWTDLYAQKTSLVTKSAAYTVVATDLGKTISCTPSTNFTVSLTAAATLGANFQCTIWNDTTAAAGYVTIDPNGSETIDGYQTWTLRRGEGLQIICNGTNWATGTKKTMRGYAENADPSATVRPIASGTAAIALAGTSGTASGNYSIVLGGQASTASGINSITLGGQNCTSSGTNSVSMGYNANAREYGKIAYGSRGASTSNAAQGGYLVVAIATADATATKLTSDAAAGSSINQLILQNNSAFAFTGTLVAKQQSTSTNSAAWKIEGLIRRDASAATTTLVASTVTAISNVPAWTTPTLTADTTNGGLSITVTGVAATNIRWVATLNSAEVYY